MKRRILQVGDKRREQLSHSIWPTDHPGWYLGPREEWLYLFLEMKSCSLWGNYFSITSWGFSHSFSWTLSWGKPLSIISFIVVTVKILSLKRSLLSLTMLPTTGEAGGVWKTRSPEVVWAQLSSPLGWPKGGCLTSSSLGPQWKGGNTLLDLRTSQDGCENNKN